MIKLKTLCRGGLGGADLSERAVIGYHRQECWEIGITLAERGAVCHLYSLLSDDIVCFADQIAMTAQVHGQPFWLAAI